MTIIRKCNPDERAAFKRITGYEPVLGSLSERLDLIVRHQGGTTRPPRALKWERQEYERWCRENNIVNVTA